MSTTEGGRTVTGSAPPATSGGSEELRAIKTTLAGLALLQVLVLVGLVIIYMQIGGVPAQTAERVPYDSSGTQTLFELGPIGTDVSDLQAKVAAMAAKLDAICTAVTKSQSAGAGPNPCTGP